MPVPKANPSKGQVPRKSKMQDLQGIRDVAPLLAVPGGGVQSRDAGSLPIVQGDGAGVDDGRCAECGDTGMRFEMRGKDRFASTCPCVARKRIDRLMQRIGIPPHFAGATLTNRHKLEGPAQQAARMKAIGYVDHFLEPAERNGLAFVGPVGTGKTYLSAAIIREVTTRYAIPCVYVDMRGIAKAVQETFGGKGRSEGEVTRPAKTAELAVLDELGAQVWTDFRADLIAEIISARYDGNLRTIVTSNLAFEMPGLRASERPAEYGAPMLRQGPTLGDQIGARMLDRLREMCEPVMVTGESLRGR